MTKQKQKKQAAEKRSFNEVMLKGIKKPLWVIINPVITDIKDGKLLLSDRSFVIYYGFKKPSAPFNNAGMKTIDNPSGTPKIFRSMNKAIEFAQGYFRKQKLR
jgi:hypothetical protein